MDNTEYTKEQEILNKYLNKISENLSYAISSYETLMTISKNSEQIKKENYFNFFFPLQRVLINDIILSLTKIFEKDKGSINIKNIVNFLECNQKQIILKENSVQILSKYNLFNFKNIKIENKIYFNDLYKKDNTIKVFNNKSFINCLQTNINILHETYKLDLEALKNIRDKSIAHSDKKIKMTYKTTWDKINKLINFIKEFIDLLSFVYLSKIYSSDNSVSFKIATSNAEKQKNCLIRILKTLSYK